MATSSFAAGRLLVLALAGLLAASCLLVELEAAGLARGRRQAADRTSAELVAAATSSPKKSKRKLAIECLAVHNKLRRLHNVPDLIWDEKLAQFAQKRSNFIAKSDGAEFKHPPDLPYGENLFWHSSTGQSCDYMVRSWYDEIQLYNFKAPSFSTATGHFTQVVWRETKRVGCATATSGGPKGGVFLTCNYDPAGNYLGEFDENVPLPRSVGAPAGGTTPPLKPVAATSTTTTTTTTTPPQSSAAPVAQLSTTSTTSTTKAPATTKPKSKKKKTKKPKNKNKKNKKSNKKNKKKNQKKKKATSTSTTTTTTSSTTARPQR